MGVGCGDRWDCLLSPFEPAPQPTPTEEAVEAAVEGVKSVVTAAAPATEWVADGRGRSPQNRNSSGISTISSCKMGLLPPVARDVAGSTAEMVDEVTRVLKEGALGTLWDGALRRRCAKLLWEGAARSAAKPLRTRWDLR